VGGGEVNVTVCEFDGGAPDFADVGWRILCNHVVASRSEIVVLPEMPFCKPFWRGAAFEQAAWDEAVGVHEEWLPRLAGLAGAAVIGSRPVTDGTGRFNEGFWWDAKGGYRRVRRKFFLPAEPAFWESEWYQPGDASFPAQEDGAFRWGLNLCSELWAVETFRPYAHAGIHAIVTPRASMAATTDKWIALGIVAAASAGAYSISSNRVDATGLCGGVGWVIDPEGCVLARTSAANPFITVSLDLDQVERARTGYPCYLFPPGASSS